MGFSCGIVGLPNVGKSTLFNALTAAAAAAENYPFCTTSPHVGTAEVPDERLIELARLLKPERMVPACLEFVDIAGLVRGASSGEGMGNEFLDNIRNVDAIAHVVRCFHDPAVGFHESVSGVDPCRDAWIVEFELLQKDLQWAERRRDKAEKLLRTGDKSASREVELYDRIIAGLNREKPVSGMELSAQDLEILRPMNPLTLKPLFYVANLGEEDLELDNAGEPDSEPYRALKKYADAEGRPTAPFYARLESELHELPDEERTDFREEMGLKIEGLPAIVRAGYESLGLITFYTKVGPELRAWTVPAGTPAPKAAGVIHTDFEKGFIKAEVISYDDFVRAGSEASARKQALVRLEGKDYEVRDGDVVHFKFNV
ncbi:MAG: redox-regulated ATPase YchF [bacterium]